MKTNSLMEVKVAGKLTGESTPSGPDQIFCFSEKAFDASVSNLAKPFTPEPGISKIASISRLPSAGL